MGALNSSHSLQEYNPGNKIHYTTLLKGVDRSPPPYIMFLPAQGWNIVVWMLCPWTRHYESDYDYVCRASELGSPRI